MYNLFISLLFLSSLGINQQPVCSRKKAEMYIETLLKKEKQKIQTLNVSFKEDSVSYHFYYSPKDSMTLGGDSYYIISKTTCKIIGGYMGQ